MPEDLPGEPTPDLSDFGGVTAGGAIGFGDPSAGPGNNVVGVDSLFRRRYLILLIADSLGILRDIRQKIWLNEMPPDEIVILYIDGIGRGHSVQFA